MFRIYLSPLHLIMANINYDWANKRDFMVKIWYYTNNLKCFFVINYKGSTMSAQLHGIK